jgi:hypothetical protein
MEGSFLRGLSSFLTLHSFSVTLFPFGFRLFLIQLQINTHKYGNITLTIITTHPKQSPLCLLFLVRLGGYIVHSLDCYSYRLIGKLTAFFQLQEFSLRNLLVTSSTTVTWLSL